MDFDRQLTFEIVNAGHLSDAQKRDILDLCSAAYGEDFSDYLEMLTFPTHILALRSKTLVSHAAWVTRSLQPSANRLLNTAYIEAVATSPHFQNRGYASAVMRQMIKHIGDYDLAALSPTDANFYRRLGWEEWQGPLAVRTDQGLVSTPEDRVMIYRLPRTPDIDLSSLLIVEWRPIEAW